MEGKDIGCGFQFGDGDEADLDLIVSNRTPSQLGFSVRRVVET